MISEDFKELAKEFDKYVESKFIELMMVSLKRYRDNPTKSKFSHIILNTPIGFFVEANDIKRLLSDNRTPGYKEIISLLKSKKEILKLMEA